MTRRSRIAAALGLTALVALALLPRGPSRSAETARALAGGRLVSRSLGPGSPGETRERLVYRFEGEGVTDVADRMERTLRRPRWGRARSARTGGFVFFEDDPGLVEETLRRVRPLRRLLPSRHEGISIRPTPGGAEATLTRYVAHR